MMRRMRGHVPLWVAAAMLIAVMAPGALAQEEPPCRQIRGEETPEDPEDDVFVCREDVWFHQAGQKAGNLAGLGQDDFPSWDTTEPEASVTEGAGGGYLATSAFHQSDEPWDPRGTATFDGAFAGDLDTLAVTLFVFAEGQEQGSHLRTDFRLLVDGEWLTDFAEVNVPLTSGGQAVRRIDFALVDLYDLTETFGLSGPDREHEIRVQVHGTGLGTDAGIFVYDTSEVPSGMVFNIEPENLEGYTVVDVDG